MKVVLYNNYHAGDVLLCRTIIRQIVAANPTTGFELQCKRQYAYLWEDLGLPITGLAEGQHHIPRDAPCINLWFGALPGMLSRGLTYANHVESYNKQASAAGLAPVTAEPGPHFVDLPCPNPPHIADGPKVLVENGPVRSGQPVYDLSHKYLHQLGVEFKGTTFYCSSKPAKHRYNLHSVEWCDLRQLSYLSERVDVIISRLSAVTVCSFTEKNHGRERVVFGSPLGCPIWDEVGMVYVSTYDEIVNSIRKVVG